MHPVPVCDRLRFETTEGGVELTCTDPTLATDGSNLVRRAGGRILGATKIATGIRIHSKRRSLQGAGAGGWQRQTRPPP